MVLDRDQVLGTDFLPELFISTMRFINASLTKGPFFTERLIERLPPSLDAWAYLPARFTIILLEYFLCLRVFRPRATLPQGVTGAGIPTGLLP